MKVMSLWFVPLEHLDHFQPAICAMQPKGVMFQRSSSYRQAAFVVVLATLFIGLGPYIGQVFKTVVLFKMERFHLQYILNRWRFTTWITCVFWRTLCCQLVFGKHSRLHHPSLGGASPCEARGHILPLLCSPTFVWRARIQIICF